MSLITVNGAGGFSPPSFRADGLLGLNLLGRCRVTLEFDSRALALRPPPARRTANPPPVFPLTTPVEGARG